MITQFVLLIVLAVNAESAKIYHKDDQSLQLGISGFNLRRRYADLVASSLSSDHPIMLLLPRVALPMEKPSDKNRFPPLSRSSSRSPGRSPRQMSSAGASSSAPAKQVPSSSKNPSAKSPPTSKAGSKEMSLRDPGNAQQHTNNPSQQQHARHRQRPIETAQANIARDHDVDTQTRPSSPLNSDVEALAEDMRKKVSLLRFSQVNQKAIESEHAEWFGGAKNNIERARINARARSAAKVPRTRRPGRIYNELKEARSAVKQTRIEAKTRIEAAADALQNRPISSPTTRVKFAKAEVAVEKAHGVAGAYYNREHQASLAATGESRWHDYPGHVKKAYKASARHTAVEAYHYGLMSEYQSKIDNEALSKMKKDDPEREKAVKVAVESRKDFHAAANIYYLRDKHYREVRNEFAEGLSSEDESKEFAAVPRKKKSP